MIELSESEQVVYLANATLLAFSDSSLSPRELAALEDLRSKVGAKKGTLNAARKAVESGTYTLSKCGGFAVQVSNLADMLYVCFVDGEFSDKERALASDFSKSIGLTEAQFELMVKNALDLQSRLSLTVSCPKCSTTADAKAKFCPNCGAPFSNITEESVKTDFEIPKVGHAIEFAESTAANFPKALEVAKKAPKFHTCIRGKKNWYLAEWPEESFVDVAHLADELGGIRNRRYYHNGSEVPWDEVFAFVWCAEQRNSAYRPIEYCFGKGDNQINPWGCKQIRFDWTEWARWFSYGQFKKSGVFKNTYTWVFDKDRIRHEVMTNLHHYRRCPHLRPDLVEAVLKALPEEVEISPASGWKYGRAYEEVPGSIKVVEIENSSGYEFKTEYFADGVRPIGLTTLRQVLTRAFAEAKVSDIKVDQLVK
jgi:hypothetical protein